MQLTPETIVWRRATAIMYAKGIAICSYAFGTNDRLQKYEYDGGTTYTVYPVNAKYETYTDLQRAINAYQKHFEP